MLEPVKLMLAQPIVNFDHLRAKHDEYLITYVYAHSAIVTVSNGNFINFAVLQQMRALHSQTEHGKTLYGH